MMSGNDRSIDHIRITRVNCCHRFCFSLDNSNCIFKQCRCVCQRPGSKVNFPLSCFKCEGSGLLKYFYGVAHLRLSVSYLYCAISGKASHCVHFIKCDLAGVGDGCNHFSQCHIDGAYCVLLHFGKNFLIVLLRANERECIAHVFYSSDRDFKRVMRIYNALLNARCRQSALEPFVFLLFSLTDQRDIKGNCHSTPCSDRSCDIPEVLGGTCCPRDDCAHLENCQESDCDQQPDECQVSDFPRALHASPVFEFAAIVARQPAGISRRVVA